MESDNHDVIFSGTKDVAEHLKFNESKLQEWFGDKISGAGKILQCPSLAYVGASAAACGGTFVSPPTQGKVCTNLANPSVSKTTSTSNFVTHKSFQ